MFLDLKLLQVYNKEKTVGVRRSPNQALRLQDAAGRCIDRLTRDEARSLMQQGKVRRVNPYTYRLITPVAPSKSEETPASLTISDILALTGARRMTEARRERLLGWGLLKA